MIKDCVQLTHECPEQTPKSLITTTYLFNSKRKFGSPGAGCRCREGAWSPPLRRCSRRRTLFLLEINVPVHHLLHIYQGGEWCKSAILQRSLAVLRSQYRYFWLEPVWRSGSTLNKTEEILNDILFVCSHIDLGLIKKQILKINEFILAKKVGCAKSNFKWLNAYFFYELEPESEPARTTAPQHWSEPEVVTRHMVCMCCAIHLLEKKLHRGKRF